MVFKFNIASKDGKTWKMEKEADFLSGRSLGDKIEGKEFGADLEGYEFEIKGGTDNAGFPLYSTAEGVGLKRVLFKKGWGMKDNRKGIRLRKTVRGRVISDKVTQVNLIIIKEGGKKLSQIFPEQNKKTEKKEAAPAPAA